MQTDESGPAHYEIHVGGHLDARWTESFDGLHLTHSDDGTTVLDGPLVDQAALHGVLQRLHDLGVPLLSVGRVRPRASAPSPGPTNPSHPAPNPKGTTHDDH